MLVGIGLVAIRGGSNLGLERELSVVLAIATVGPIVATFALRRVVPGYDLVLVCAAAMLASIGATMHFYLATTPGSNQPFFATIASRHLIFVVVGYIAMVAGAVFTRRIDKIREYPFTLLGLTLVLTAVTVAFGQTINGARLWLQLGPVQFQPSEIARLFLAGFVASYLYDRRHLVAAPWRLSGIDLPPAPHLLPLVGAVLGAVAILVLQNDLGMAALVVFGAVVTVVGVVRGMSSIAVATAVLAVAAVAAFTATPRIRVRVAGWLDPWRDAAESGFQFVQADFSVAAGGLMGSERVAPALSVPEVHTDFILVGVATQFGWAGALAVLVLAGVLVCRCALAALRAGDGFRSLLVFSLSALLGIQVVLIAGGTLRVLPLTGLTFPLLSYGGTSMVATMFALGIVAGLGASGDGRTSGR